MLCCTPLVLFSVGPAQTWDKIQTSLFPKWLIGPCEYMCVNECGGGERKGEREGEREKMSALGGGRQLVEKASKKRQHPGKRGTAGPAAETTAWAQVW